MEKKLLLISDCLVERKNPIKEVIVKSTFEGREKLLIENKLLKDAHHTTNPY